MTNPLHILFEDPHILAVSKPPGLLTQGKPGVPTLESAVRLYLPPDAYLGTVHRLDRPVSGLILWAKTPKAARRLSQQFEARKTTKEYWAVAESSSFSKAPEGTWEDWLTPHSDPSGVVHILPPESPGARRAVSRYRVETAINLPEATVWLRLWPQTGRTHQLRAQSAAQGLPILGDSPYGASRLFPQGIALHARTLAFLHPISRETLTLTAPLPASWAEQGITLPGRSAEPPDAVKTAH